ncbi:MAG TPA: methyltransferase domain-containing protein [Thermoanaerobaculia bacterium]
MDRDLLGFLRCPFCGGHFRASALEQRGNDLYHGLLRCSCDRYPVVCGIPVLLKERQALLDEVRGALASGQPEHAFLALVGRPLPHGLEARVRMPPARRALRRLHQRVRRPRFAYLGPATGFGEGGEATTAELLELYCDQSPEDYHYLAYRFGHPRHLAALAMTSLVRQRNGPLLDLACGCGHTAFTLRQMAPGQPLFGIDIWFFGLWLASRRCAPGGAFLCCRADGSLPFASKAFASAVCVDSLHYFDDKAGAARELARVVAPRGSIVLTGLHNRNVERPLQFGDPLTPEGYSRLFAGLPHRLLADDRTLERYLAGKGPDLANGAARDLAHASLLSLVTSRDASALPASVELPATPPHCQGPPAWNPLYAQRRRGEAIELVLRVPSEAFVADQGKSWGYLPPSALAPASADEEIRRGEWTPSLRRLAERFVVLAMPPGFFQPSTPAVTERWRRGEPFAVLPPVLKAGVYA